MKALKKLFLLVVGGYFLAVQPVTGNDVFLSGFLHYQNIGKRKLEADETLGAFVERLGGIIRGEYDVNGEREIVHCAIYVHREGKHNIFRFDKDGAKAWAFKLKDDDTIEIAERMLMPADLIPKAKLKFAPAKFKRDGWRTSRHWAIRYPPRVEVGGWRQTLTRIGGGSQ